MTTKTRIEMMLMKVLLMVSIGIGISGCGTQIGDFDPTGTWSMQFQPLLGGDCNLAAVKPVAFDVEASMIGGSLSYLPSIPEGATAIDGAIQTTAEGATYDGRIFTASTSETDSVMLTMDVEGVISGFGTVIFTAPDRSCSQPFAVDGQLQ